MAAIVIWLITFAGCCLVGLPLLFREGWSMGELRKMARDEEQAGEADCWQKRSAPIEAKEKPPVKCPFCAHIWTTK